MIVSTRKTTDCAVAVFPPTFTTSRLGVEVMVPPLSVNTNSTKTTTISPFSDSFRQSFSTECFAYAMYIYGDFYFQIDGCTTLQDDLISNLKCIDDIAALTPNWNENGAPRFSESLIEKAKSLLYLFPKQPRIFPTACRSIQFEFNNKKEDYLEIEIFEDGQNKVFLVHKDKSYTETMVSDAEIIGIIEEFYGE